MRPGYSVIEATNWYAYVSNNPVLYVDPTGMELKWIQGEGVSDEAFEEAKEMGERIANSDTEAGKRWRAAEKSRRTVRIEVNNEGKNNARPGDNEEVSNQEYLNSVNSTGGEAYIKFDPEKRGKLAGGISRIPKASLAHEMAHAYLMIEGEIPRFRKGAELDATAVENQYRDSIDLPQRQLYGNWAVPQYNSDTNTFNFPGTNKEYTLREVK